MTLLSQWRKSPARELAEALEVELAAVEAAPAPVDQKAWLRAAKALGTEADARALAPLLGSLQGKTLADTVERFVALKKTLPDPRVAAAFVNFVRAVPFTSDTSKPSWTTILPLVAAAGDPRAIEQVRQARQAVAVRPLFQTWFQRRLDDLVETLEAAFPNGVPTVDAKTRAKLVTTPAPKVKPAREKSLDALRAAVFATPADDAPRLVLADALQEAGDPRGEFIALQCTASNPKRERELLKAHGKQWLGALGPWVGSEVVFRRGFPSEVTLKLKNEKEARAAEQVPDWATIEVVHVANPPGGSSVNEKWSQYFPSTMQGLREVHDLRGSGAARLLEVAPGLRLDVLGFVFRAAEPAEADALLAAPLASKVRVLHFAPWESAAQCFARLECYRFKDPLTAAQVDLVQAHPRLRLEHEPPDRGGVEAVFTHVEGAVALHLTLHGFAERHPGFDFLGPAEQAKSVQRYVDDLLARLAPLCQHPAVKDLVIERAKPKANLVDAKAEARGLAALKALRAPKTLRRCDYAALG